MKLNLQGIREKIFWEKGYLLPKFDILKVKEETIMNPTWIHFGAGNIFRAYMAKLQQQLLNQGISKTGIIIAEGYDYEIIDKVFSVHDNLTLGVELRSDGTVEKEVIASITHAFKCDPIFEDDFKEIIKVFENPSLQIVSFTITEKGYSLLDSKGNIFKEVNEDFIKGFEKPKSYLGKVTYLLYKRFLACKTPLTLLSMDNMSHNGDKLKEAILCIANKWLDYGIEKEFYSYLKSNVSYPCSMIDKITPRPDELVSKMLSDDGFTDNKAVITSKNTYIAPYVNAEETEYFVVENNFKNSRPLLEKVGVIFTDKETVDKVEKMKVCTCLNPLHTALAIFGCLLGYTKISDLMNDKTIVKLVNQIGYDEGLKVVIDPKIIDPKKFIKTVIEVRLPNPFMPDSPQRIATDTSQKLSIRFGETIKKYLENPKLNVSDLKIIPLIYAGWLRYLMGIDDKGKVFDVSPDPLLNELSVYIEKLNLGTNIVLDDIKDLLENENIFGINLLEIGLDTLIINYFNELNAGTNAIRETLEKHLIK